MLCPKTWVLTQPKSLGIESPPKPTKNLGPTEILQSEAELEVWGIKIKHKDAQGNYP
jgi:hypothetical protein